MSKTERDAEDAVVASMAAFAQYQDTRKPMWELAPNVWKQHTRIYRVAYDKMWNRLLDAEGYQPNHKGL